MGTESVDHCENGTLTPSPWFIFRNLEKPGQICYNVLWTFAKFRGVVCLFLGDRNEYIRQDHRDTFTERA